MDSSNWTFCAYPAIMSSMTQHPFGIFSERVAGPHKYVHSLYIQQSLHLETTHLAQSFN
jgi:hypothetical protein